MEGDDINQRRFDDLMEIILQLPEDGHVVIDNGAATFLPLCCYLKDNNALDFLCSEGHEILLHTVITGGQAVVDTATGLKTLATSFPNCAARCLAQPIFRRYRHEWQGVPRIQSLPGKSRQISLPIIEIPQRKQSTFW